MKERMGARVKERERSIEKRRKRHRHPDTPASRQTNKPTNRYFLIDTRIKIRVLEGMQVLRERERERERERREKEKREGHTKRKCE